MHWFGFGSGTWMYVLMTATTLGLWALVITGVVVMARSTGRGERRTEHRSGQRPPEETLADRFARGDINAAEYEERLTTLRAHHTP